MFCDDVFDPGHFLAVRRDGGLFKAMRGREKIDDVLCGERGFRLRGGGETRFGGLLRAAGLLRGGPLRRGKKDQCSRGSGKSR